MKTKTYIQIDYNELDNLINKHYGFTGKQLYECVAENEWSNDSKHSVTVMKGQLHKYDSVEIEKFKNSDKCYIGLGTILCDMCNAGAIEPGEYLITVCW